MGSQTATDQALTRLPWRCRERAGAGWFDGTMASRRYIQRCTHRLEIDPERYAQVIYTRDRGHHTSGWWKNPDYELCRHLSLSFQYIDGTPAPRDRPLTDRICEALFADHLRLIWCEPPYSDHGKQLDVWHYRLFIDAQGAPILPRGEVYSTKFTELGWKSWSELFNGRRVCSARPLGSPAYGGTDGNQLRPESWVSEAPDGDADRHGLDQPQDGEERSAAARETEQA